MKMIKSPNKTGGVSRRGFIRQTLLKGLYWSGLGVGLCAFKSSLGLAHPPVQQAPNDPNDPVTGTPARYWLSIREHLSQCNACHPEGQQSLDNNHRHADTIVKCMLCAQECLLQEGQRGRCNARVNHRGELRSLVYGRPVAMHVDPIEKKPFYHFMPGSSAFSLATTGCPLSCRFCQNWQLSQARPEDYNTRYTPPADIVTTARHQKAPIIAFTYNEPTVFTEYLTDIARIAREKECRSVLISCGFMKRAPLDEMCDVLDAIKIDLKGFDPGFYRNICGAELKPVTDSIKHVAQRGRHLEIVNLVVPTLNDSPRMLTELCKWIMGEIGPDVPVHFTRFHPAYKLLNLPPTPVDTLEQAYAIAQAEGLHYPYVGNVPGHPGNNTYCPQCHRPVIERNGFFMLKQSLQNGACQYCGQKIAGVWQ